jgi:DNA-binding NtrC family response regulator
MPIHPEYNILLVEDDPDHASLINRAFETEAHCRLVITTTLAQAKSLINHTPPDLVITDIRLPDGHGTELLAPATGFPTIVMTSHGDEKVAVSAIKSGAAEYIVKTQESLASLPRTANRVMREWRLVIDQKLATERQQRLTAILEATPDLICIANLDGFLTYINQSGRNLLGIGKNFTLLPMARRF